jgi:hypothetical protein
MQDVSLEDRGELARAIVGLLDSWGVAAADQVGLLDLPEGTPSRAIRRYRREEPLPDDPKVMQRVEHLIGIADALRTSFPQNPNMALLWMHNRHRKFRRRTPLQTMIEDGHNGVIQVRTYLDCSFAWRMSGSTT